MVESPDKKAAPASLSDKYANEAPETSQNTGIPTLEIADICFVPSTGMLHIFTTDELKAIEREEKLLDNALKPVQDVRNKTNATAEELQEAQQKAQEKMKLLDLEPLASSGSTGALTEIRRLRGGKLTYVRSDVMENHTRHYRLDADDRNRSRLRNDAGKLDLEKIKKAIKKDIKSLEVGMEWTIFDEKDLGAVGEWANTFADELNWQFGDEQYRNDPARMFDASVESQWMRYAAGASYATTMQPLKGKLALALKIESSMALGEAKTQINVHLPDAKGLALCFDMENKQTGQMEEVNLGDVRLELGAKVGGFVGASAALNAGVGFDVGTRGNLALVNIDAVRETVDRASRKEQKAAFSGELFAGAKAECEADAAIEWRNPEKGKEFAAVAKAGAGVNVAGGAGVEGDVGFYLKGGRFLFRAKAGVVCGVGAGGEVTCMVDGNTFLDFVQLVYHTLMLKDYNYLKFIEPKAFDLLSAYLVKYLSDKVETLTDTYDTFAQNLADFKMWWKVYVAEQEESEQLARNIIVDKGAILRYASPEAQGRILAILSRRFWLNMEELQEKAILKVLKGFQCRREAELVYKHMTLDGSKISIEEGRKKLFAVLDGREQTKYNAWWNNLPKTVPEEKKLKKIAMVNVEPPKPQLAVKIAYLAEQGDSRYV